jgi:hypothetical protein
MVVPFHMTSERGMEYQRRFSNPGTPGHLLHSHPGFTMCYTPRPQKLVSCPRNNLNMSLLRIGGFMLLRAAGGSLLRAATFRQVPCGRPQIFNRRPGQARPPARAAPRPVPVVRDRQARRAGTEDQGCNNAHPLGLLRGDYYELGAVERAQGEFWLRLSEETPRRPLKQPNLTSGMSKIIKGISGTWHCFNNL